MVNNSWNRKKYFCLIHNKINKKVIIIFALISLLLVLILSIQSSKLSDINIIRAKSKTNFGDKLSVDYKNKFEKYFALKQCFGELNSFVHDTDDDIKYGFPYSIEKYVKESKRKLAFQQTLYERSALYFLLQCLSSTTNFLVWGTGLDTKQQAKANSNGTTYFLEHNQKQVDIGNTDLEKDKSLNAKIFEVSYNTKLTDENNYFDKLENIAVHLPNTVQEKRFDLVLIDAPEGFQNDNPGRMASIYTTRLLIQKQNKNGDINPVIVALHDTERHVEKKWGNVIFGKPALIVDNLSFQFIK